MPEAKPPSDAVTYRLKGMVMVRLLAEATALIILFVLPGILLALGYFMQLSMITKVIICLLSLLALLVLPFYTAVAYKVKVDSEGVSTFSLFASQFADWASMTELKLKTSWGWRRYVVTSGGGDLTIPVWLHNLPALVAQIRQRLPNRGYGNDSGGVRVFRQDKVSLMIQIGKSVASLLFLAVFWAFALSLKNGSASRAKADPTDFLIMLAACVVVSAVIVLRFIIAVTMPRFIELKAEGLLVETLFGKFDLPWVQLKSVTHPWFFLPEGLVIKTTTGRIFMIGDQLEAFDELQEELTSRDNRDRHHREITKESS